MNIRKLIGMVIILKGMAITGYGQETKMPVAFTVTSVQTQQSYKFGYTLEQKTFTAIPGYQLVLISFVISNKTDIRQQFSSERFLLFDKDGKGVTAVFIGVGNEIAETGAIITIDDKISNPDKVEIVTYKGKLNIFGSFIEWSLAPRQAFSDTLVYVVPLTAQGIRCEFRDLDNETKKDLKCIVGPRRVDVQIYR
jgi:hypothetical protein